MSQRELGQFIKIKVLPKELKQIEVAEQLGVTRQALSRLLNGHSTLSEDMASKLKKAYEADAETLLDKQRAILEPKRALATKSVRNYSSRFWDISSDDIAEYFSRKKIGRDEFPQLVRMLVRAQNSSLSKCDFHAGDNAERKGWDGETEADSATANVPKGYAIWELGTNSNPRNKAESDYNKSLTKQTTLSDEVRTQTTYIFVTPHNWEKAKDWAKSKAALGDYANVIAFDASSIEQWIELHPTVQVWFAEKTGASTRGVTTLETFWRQWAGTAKPNVSPLIFKHAIESSSEELKNWLEGTNKGVFSIQAGTRKEVGAFLGAAWILDQELKDLLIHCVIVDDKTDLSKLAASSDKLIPIALDGFVAKECVRFFGDRPIIVSRDVSATSVDGSDINIDLPDHDAFILGLKDMGFGASEIELLEAQTNHSPTILRRVLAKLPEEKLPPWARKIENHLLLLPVFLAGCWQKRKEDDVAFVEALSKACGINDYHKVENELSRLANIEEPPVWIESDFRGVASKLESLLVLGPYITEEILDEFLELAELLLSEYDPALELEKDKRWAAEIYKKTRKSSGVLRLSITQTLILLAVHGSAHISSITSVRIQGKIDKLISNLLKDGSARNWLSQNGLLRHYAEASPDSFLLAVKRELASTSSVFDEMFMPVESSSFGASPDRTDVLWALELLAWSKAQVVDACYALAELCRYPCDDNWANKPFASLNDILLYWRPHTCLDVSERKKLLNALYKKYPKVGWSLAANTFTRMGSTSGTNKPKFRNWASGINEAITYGEIWDYSDACRNILLEHTPYTINQIYELVRIIDGFPKKDEEKILHLFSIWKNTATKEEFVDVRELIRTSTRTKRSVQRRKKKQKPEESFISGSALLEVFQPRNIVEKHAWLFLKSYVEESLDEIEEGSDIDFKARDNRINMLRLAAMSEIWKHRGKKGVNEILNLSKDGFIVGTYLASIDILDSDLVDFIFDHFANFSLDKRRNEAALIEGILRKKAETARELFYGTKSIFERFGEQFDASTFCTLMCFSNETFQLVNELEKEVQLQYWKKVFPNYHRDSGIELNEFVHQLLEVERPLAALFSAKFDSKRLETSTLIKLLDSIATCDPKLEQNYQLDNYRVCKLIEELRQRADVSQDALSRTEFTYAPILVGIGSHGSIPTLIKVLLSDPMQYFQLIALCYFRKDRKNDFAELGLPEEEPRLRNLTETASHIIDNLDELPGYDQRTISNKIEEGIKWISSVIDLAIKYDRSVVAKLRIGNILANCKVGQDGIWPCEHARGLLEHFQDEDIGRGFNSEKRNKRGVTMRPRPENGNQERAIAQTFFEDANNLSIEYPFTATVLRNIGKSYESEAEMHDREGRLERKIPH